MSLSRTNTEEFELYESPAQSTRTVAYNHNATGTDQLLVLGITFSLERGIPVSVTYDGVAPDETICDATNYEYGDGNTVVPMCLTWKNPSSGTNNIVITYSGTVYRTVLHAQSFTDAVIGNISLSLNVPNTLREHDFYVNPGSMIYTFGQNHDQSPKTYTVRIDGVSFTTLSSGWPDYILYDGDFDMWFQSDGVFAVLHNTALTVGVKNVKFDSTELNVQNDNDHIILEINDITIDDIPQALSINIGKLFIDVAY